MHALATSPSIQLYSFGVHHHVIASIETAYYINIYNQIIFQAFLLFMFGFFYILMYAYFLMYSSLHIFHSLNFMLYISIYVFLQTFLFEDLL